MPKLPRIPGKDILNALKRAGFSIVHIRGSHHYLRKGDDGKLVVVPVHSKEIVPPKTLQSILEQAQMNGEDFIEFL